MDQSIETTLRNKYNISSLYPERWPDEKDAESSSDEEDAAAAAAAAAPPPRRSKSRYSVLEGRSSFSRQLPGAERTKDGVENLVQKDEGDPLGTYPSVVQVLRQRGLPVEDDIKLRNRFLLSSTTFSPSLFLSNVHSSASTDSLLSGLDFLSRSIEKKSASLKVLVENNFERFVGAKATIDRVYNEMRDVGKEQPEPPSSRRSQHSRGASRSSFSSRKPSESLAPAMGKTAHDEKKKNALLKESEYGVHGIKVPLTEVAVKAEEVWGPALNGQEKEANLKKILESVEEHRDLFEIGPAIQDAIRRRDHDMIRDKYSDARRYTERARGIVVQAADRQAQLSDAEIHQIIVTARMWSDVEQQVEAFKRDAWRRLSVTHFTTQQVVVSDEAKSEQYMGLISIMLDLGVEDNPIWIWLLSRYEYLKNRLVTTCERSKVEIEILRRHLANAEKPSLRVLAKHLRAVPTNSNMPVEPTKLDSPKVIEFWEHVHASMTTLLAVNGGLLGELLEYWDIAQSFISGQAQKSLPLGYNSESSIHHKLVPDNIVELEKGVTELINIIREHVYSFFSDPPIEDISLLFSPVPSTPTPSTPMSAVLSPTSASRSRFNFEQMPPPSPNRGETWEKYAFWPPNSNALSGSHYLSKTLTLIGTAANELASLRLPETGSTVHMDDALRTLVGGVRERCVQAVCVAWNNDARDVKVLEDWTRNADRKDITNMPSRFLAIQTFELKNLQSIMYIEASGTTSVNVLIPPSGKLLQLVRSQFATSFFHTITGMVQCASEGRSALGKDFEVQGDDLTVGEDEEDDGAWGRVDASKKSTRLLLTLSNMQCLQSEITPQLLSQFETLFSVQLPDETARIRDILTQLDAKLFEAYTKTHHATIASTIEHAIFAPTWAPDPAPGRGVADRDPSPYVFSVLLSLVIVHTEVSTTSPPLTPRILRSLFESTTQTLIATFERLPQCSLSALMQATLDVEFMAQTLAAYTTEKASQIQTDIYQVLDKKTDNAARVRLQEELGSLRHVLKRLREGTKVEFACFRRKHAGTMSAGTGG